MVTVTPSIRYVLTVIIMMLGTLSNLSAQQQVNGGLQSKDSASLTVIRVYPDSFPRVSVLFRATAPNGQPLWNLSKDNVGVKENEEDCEVISVQKVSANQRVNTALVIDHSGSMLENPEYYRWADSVNKLPKRWRKTTLREHTKGKVNSDSVIMVSVTPECPAEFQPPMYHAKMAAKAYISSIDSSKDRTALVGFSETVSTRLPLSGKRMEQRTAIESMVAQGSTAFYDAVFAALEEVNKGDGVKAVVAMTDGEDNASKHSLAQVIARAKELEIPVYVVGVGNANKKVLRKLAKQTGGEYFFTNDPSRLTSIYLSISRKISSIYELVYESPSMASADSTREVELTFEVGNEFLHTRKLGVALPPEVIKHLTEKETAAEELAQAQQSSQVTQPNTTSQESNSNLPYAAGVVVLIAGAGVLTARYVKKQKQKKEKVFEITSIYPNPTAGPITIVVSTDLSGMPGRVVVIDSAGTLAATLPFAGGTAMDADLTALPNGVYHVAVEASGNRTMSLPVVITH